MHRERAVDRASRKDSQSRCHDRWANRSFRLTRPHGQTLGPGDGQTVAILEGHRKQVVCVAFEPGGRRVATASSDRTVRIWSADTGKELMKLPFPAASPTAVAWGKELYLVAGKGLLAFNV